MKRYHSQQNIDLETSPHCEGEAARGMPPMQQCLERGEPSLKYRENTGRVKSEQGPEPDGTRASTGFGQNVFVAVQWRDLRTSESQQSAVGKKGQGDCPRPRRDWLMSSSSNVNAWRWAFATQRSCYLMRPDTPWERELRQREEDGIITGNRVGGKKVQKGTHSEGPAGHKGYAKRVD